MVIGAICGLVHELFAFRPAEFHWPTALITTLTLVAFYCTNQLIATAVYTSPPQPKPQHKPAAATPPPPPEPPAFDAAMMLDFYLLLGRLKTTKRTGWVDHNVPQPESIADHMYRLTMLFYTLTPYLKLKHAASADGSTAAPPPLHRPLLMSLTHDLAECIAGDITPTEYSGVSKAEKHKREADAMHHTLSYLPATQRSEVHALWHEYEADDSDAARLLHDCDKLEMIVQAFEYEREEHRRRRGSLSANTQGGLDAGRRRSIGSFQKPLDRFYESCHKIRDERVRQVALEVRRRRHKELLDGIGEHDHCADS